MRRRSRWLALGLILLAPTVGEFLLGNVPISQYPFVLLLCPLYGGGALLIRESARRLGAGWPTIVLFASAYALVEEGPVDQMIFNPGYLGLPSFAGFGEIPGLGISGSLVIASLALHTVWSICVPIAVLEAFDPTPTRPWLGRPGWLLTASFFVAGCVFLGMDQARSFDFVGTPAQFAVAGIAIVALVVAGVVIGRRSRAAVRPPDAKAPRPWLVGVASFALTSLYWLSAYVPGGDRLGTQVACAVVAVAVAVTLVLRWSRAEGWDARHRLALAAGAAATYALWYGPTQAVQIGTGAVEIVVGAVVFGGVVLVLVLAGHRAIRTRDVIRTGCSGDRVG